MLLILVAVFTGIVGMVSSDVDIVSVKNSTCSVAVYAKQRTVGVRNVIVRGEWGRAVSYD
jgi:hypothetical protein